MARQLEIVIEIMAKGKEQCIVVLNGKKFGTLLGELLKMIKMAEEDKDKARKLFMQCDQMVDDLKERVTALSGYKQLADELEVELEITRQALECRTPEGLKDSIGVKITHSIEDMLEPVALVSSRGEAPQLTRADSIGDMLKDEDGVTVRKI